MFSHERWPDGAWLRELQEGAGRLGLPLPPEALALFRRYMAEILRWQARVNITGFRTAGAIARDGFLDSLSCLLALPQGPIRIVDVGSGAGFPGLPIKIARAGVALTLVEANRRRHSFLAHMCRVLKLEDARCLQGRAEDLAGDPGLAARFDAAFARAVGRLDAAGALLAGFLRPGGVFVGQQLEAAVQEPPAIRGYTGPSAIVLPALHARTRMLLIYTRTP